MKYIAYTRKSKAKKVKNKEGEWVEEQDPLSHHFQAMEIRKFVGDAELMIFAETDVSRDSALETRPVLCEALDNIDRGDVLIVWKSDRIVADQAELLRLLIILEKRRAKAISICEPNFFDNNPMSEFMRTVMVGVNRFEVQNIRMRIKKALQAKKARGERVGHIPYGYCATNQNMIIPDDIEQGHINLMAKLYFERGLNYREVAECLNNEGILNRRGSQWSKSAIHRILKARPSHADAYLPQGYTNLR